MNDKPKLLLAEDDPKLGQNILKVLEESGFETTLAYDGKMADSFFRQNEYDLVILDINLPYINGIELCSMFRAKNKEVPIIMLTALGEIQDKMDAFGAGADDYVIKPFHYNELVARIKVFLKRKQSTPDTAEILRIADLELNTFDKSVKRGEKNIVLTAKEFMLLELLLRNKGRVLPKSEIAEKVWEIHFDTGTNTIEVYINFLRNKVDKPFEQKLIHTKQGFGYYMKEQA